MYGAAQEDSRNMRATLRKMMRLYLALLTPGILLSLHLAWIPLCCADINVANAPNTKDHMDLILPCNTGAVIYMAVGQWRSFNIIITVNFGIPSYHRLTALPAAFVPFTLFFNPSHLL
ncbi:hypothetical protein ACN42_g1237 [Penicillium freii]|uniref:Uncharacterized protein n=1 Tax=Penicillium freii TaxID=48697 RepID=A0A101MSA9_PENFR|nr:hypothetical protein ACN42_g1237 [Penicillium freii]